MCGGEPKQKSMTLDEARKKAYQIGFDAQMMLSDIVKLYRQLPDDAKGIGALVLGMAASEGRAAADDIVLKDIRANCQCDECAAERRAMGEPQPHVDPAHPEGD